MHNTFLILYELKHYSFCLLINIVWSTPISYYGTIYFDSFMLTHFDLVVELNIRKFLILNYKTFEF